MAMFGFTPWQIEVLEGFFNQKLTAPPALPPASPPAPKPCAQTTPPELPPQLPPLPPPPSTDVLKEVEYPPKHKASKAVLIIRVAKSSEYCIGWPPKFGGINMRFSRDEEPDAWYTTMLQANARNRSYATFG